MKVRVLKTTDGKHVGAIFDVPDLSYNTVKTAAGMNVEHVVQDGGLIHLINVNYRVTLKIIEE